MEARFADMRDATETASKLVPPYGGQLVSLLAPDAERLALIAKANTLPSAQLTLRSVCDLELLAVGAFSPLNRFMGKADYLHVLKKMRLASGVLFPIPITLPVAKVNFVTPGQEIVLRSPRNEPLAILAIEEVFEWDPAFEAQAALGTTDPRHPLVAEMASWERTYVSGPLTVINLPRHYDFSDLRRSPVEIRELLDQMGYGNVVAFQTRNPMHRAHEWITKRAADEVRGALLIQPAVGLTKPGDVDYHTRVRCYRALVERYYDPRRTLLSLIPLAMRMGGPREAVWHAIIRRNYGANAFIVGRDHASSGKDSANRPFYNPYDAQRLLASLESELGVRVITFDEVVYLPDTDAYEEAGRVPPGARVFSLSGTEVRGGYLGEGKHLPDWFTRPEVADILARAHPPRDRRGFCVWFTGLSGAGKSTIAEALTEFLMEHGRQVTVLDGDVVRTHLSKGLGFSKSDRDANILRIGFVASEIVRHNGAVIVAVVSPYRSARNQVRAMIGGGRFILVYVNTPLEVCEQRDTKGLYAKARRGEIREFTGIDDPYEVPLKPELVLETLKTSPEDNAKRIVDHLADAGFLAETDEARQPS